MLFADATMADFLQTNIVLISGGIVAMWGGISAMFIWLGRVVWVKVDAWLEARKQAAIVKADAEAAALKLKAEKDARAVEVLTETLPKLAENATRLTALTESHVAATKDVVTTQLALHGAFVDLADCNIANACPETQERFTRDVEKVKNRIKSVSPFLSEGGKPRSRNGEEQG